VLDGARVKNSVPLAEWEQELLMAIVIQNGGVGWSVRDPIFIEQPSPEMAYDES
jgi:hypothetical protein